MKIAKGVYIASPALCFIQMAEIFAHYDAMKCGFELAGLYRLDRFDPRGFSDAKPLVAISDIKAMLRDVCGLYGKKAVQGCLPFILPDSASPRETQLAMLFCGSRKSGAYGLPRMLLNSEINLDEVGRAMVRSRYCRVDMCWPEANLAVEYDSDFGHAGSAQIASDSARRGALLRMGMDVIGVTRLQMNNSYALDGVVSVIEGRLGMRPRSANGRWRYAQAALRTQVVKFDRYGFRPTSDIARKKLGS